MRVWKVILRLDDEGKFDLGMSLKLCMGWGSRGSWGGRRGSRGLQGGVRHWNVGGRGGRQGMGGGGVSSRFLILKRWV